MKQLLNEVLEKIKPNAKEAENYSIIIKDLTSKVSETNVETMVVGSIAKGTNLKSADIDLFIKFESGTDLKKEGLDIARKILPNGKELYAQHPYLRGEINGIGIDVVPCYAINDSSKPVSAVDRTPYHTEWVNQNIKGREDDVRLAKQFLKGCGAYGAGAAIGGFSGYLVEILCIKYGSFTNLVNEIANWKPPIVMDKIEEAQDAPIIIKDPVDSNRNVAAGVTVKGLGTAILASKGFIENPSKDFFFPKDKERETKGFVTTISMKLPEGTEETILPWLQKQARKIYRAVKDFEPIAWNANLDQKGFIVIETATIELPKIVPHKGPAPWDGGAIEFLKKYPDASLVEGKLEIGKPPRHSKIEDVIIELLPESKVKLGLEKGAIPAQRVPWLS
ncbi:MAG: CCA tRNA nucleotidyltransferase [Candidatus Poseidoniales archaeon]